jgi:hypothetical protein
MAAPQGNNNAEQWTEEEGRKIFESALDLSDSEEYDFIGEIARELKTYRDVFKYLADKYDTLKPLHNRLLSNLEANCFSHSKKGLIKEATAIMNLKSNYRWTDRNDHTSQGEKIDTALPPINVYNCAPPLAESEDGIK